MRAFLQFLGRRTLYVVCGGLVAGLLTLGMWQSGRLWISRIAAPRDGERWERLDANADSSLSKQVIRFEPVVLEILRLPAECASSEERRLVWSALRGLRAEHGEVDAEGTLLVDEALTWVRSAGAGDEAGLLLGLVCERGLVRAVREGAMQHVGRWMESHPMKASFVDALEGVVVGEKGTPIAGMALLGVALSDAASERQDWLAVRVREIASARESHCAARVSAMEVAVRMGLAGFETVAREWSGERYTALERIEALQYLGAYGDVETLRWMEGQSVPTDLLILEVWRGTMKKLRTRFSQSNAK